MTFLPIVARELRIASRRRSTYWTRTVLGLMACVIWLFMLMTGKNGIPRTQIGTVLFAVVGGLAMAFSLFAGVFLTADCLSEERREGTLGLLFLTELRGYDVVLGKLVATSLPAIYGLLTIFPVLALPLLMGGVSIMQFWRVVLVLLATLALSLCAGLAVSAFSQDARQAMSRTFLVMVVFSTIMPLLGWLQSYWLGGRQGPAYFWPSPGYLYYSAFDGSYRFGGSRDYWGGLATVIALAAAALGLANLRVRRAWQEGSEGRVRRNAGALMRKWRFGDETYRASRRPLLDTNPFYWLASRDRLNRTTIWGSIAILFVLLLGTLAQFFSPSLPVKGASFVVGLFVVFGIHLVVKWILATEASRRFSEDRASGALELLLVTPLPANEIINGQRRALLRTFWIPCLLACAANFFYLGVIVGSASLQMAPKEQSTFAELFIGGLFLLLSDYYALSWVGMWMGLSGRVHQRAVLATIARVMFLPWLALIFLWFLGVSGAFNSPDDGMVMFFVWQAFFFVTDLVLAVIARRRLFREFQAQTRTDFVARAR